MSKRDWRTAGIAGLTLIAAFAIGGFILGQQLGHQEGQRDAKTQEYAHEAAQEIEGTCVGLGGQAELKCIVDVVEATNGHERAENDLIAQRNMARWALYMLLATLVMAGITALGVFYVWQTLVATQKMAKETREIGQAQVRAHLHLEPIDVIIEATDVEGVDSVRAYIRGKIHNTGASPAYRVKTMFEFKQAKRGEVVAVNVSGRDLEGIQHTMASIPPKGSSFVEFERTFPADLEALRNGRSSVGLSYALECTDIFEVVVNEPIVTGVFREHPQGSGKLVLMHSRVVTKDD